MLNDLDDKHQRIPEVTVTFLEDSIDFQAPTVVGENHISYLFQKAINQLRAVVYHTIECRHRIYKTSPIGQPHLGGHS